LQTIPPQVPTEIIITIDSQHREESDTKMDPAPNPNLEAAHTSKKRRPGPSKERYDNDYTELASLMVENPEKAIVRRFALLNVKNLRYMQAELVGLEDQLEKAGDTTSNFRILVPMRVHGLRDSSTEHNTHPIESR
jgi:hypothetical protein